MIQNSNSDSNFVYASEKLCTTSDQKVLLRKSHYKNQPMPTPYDVQKQTHEVQRSICRFEQESGVRANLWCNATGFTTDPRALGECQVNKT